LSADGRERTLSRGVWRSDGRARHEYSELHRWIEVYSIAVSSSPTSRYLIDNMRIVSRASIIGGPFGDRLLSGIRSPKRYRSM